MELGTHPGQTRVAYDVLSSHWRKWRLWMAGKSYGRALTGQDSKERSKIRNMDDNWKENIWEKRGERSLIREKE